MSEADGMLMDQLFAAAERAMRKANVLPDADYAEEAGDWPPEEGEDRPLDPDFDFISDVPEEFPGGF